MKIKKVNILPNALTSGNLICGLLSIMLVWQDKYLPAAWLILAAMLFDFMDGKVARMLGGSSEFGKELDSLADVVSFGVAPAFLIYATYLFYYGVVGALVASSFVVFGALRLARFNIQNISEYFIGLPIPSGGGLLAGIVLSNYAFHPSLVMGLVIVTGIMMVSEFRYANLKHLDKNSVDWKRFFMFMSGIGLLVLLLRGKLVLAVFLVYLISGPLGVNWEKMVIKDHYQMDKNEEDTEGEEV